MQAFSQKSYYVTQKCQMRVYIDERTRFLTKAAIKRVQNDACISYAEREQARPKVKDEKTKYFAAATEVCKTNV